jgi:hypothetical protein
MGLERAQFASSSSESCDFMILSPFNLVTIHERSCCLPSIDLPVATVSLAGLNAFPESWDRQAPAATRLQLPPIESAHSIRCRALDIVSRHRQRLTQFRQVAARGRTEGKSHRLIVPTRNFSACALAADCPGAQFTRHCTRQSPPSVLLLCACEVRHLTPRDLQSHVRRVGLLRPERALVVDLELR